EINGGGHYDFATLNNGATSHTFGGLPAETVFNVSLKVYAKDGGALSQNDSVSTLADSQVQEPPSATPSPTPMPTNTPTSTHTPAPQRQLQPAEADAGLLAEIEAKIARHRDVTGRGDLVIAFTAARQALSGKDSVAKALELAIYDSEIWNRIRAALHELNAQNPSPQPSNTPIPPPTNTPIPPPSNTPIPPPTNTPIPPPSNTPIPPPTNTPIPPPSNTPIPPPTNTPIPPPTNTPVPPPTNTPVPPTNTPIPPPTNTPVPPPTNTPVPPPPQEPEQPQVDAGLLAEVEAKIKRHREKTGRDDLVAGFSAVRDGLLGNISPDEALAAIQSGWRNELWDRIRAALNQLKG
ncbi:MAG: hypothetical protein OXG85_09695, partial [Chloroflexi bacterium]|nr:hypothetical protein [Chloroflexota bacterium]